MLENYSDVLTINDLMEILHIGRNTAYKLVNTGTLKVLRIGRKIRIPKTNLMDYLTSTRYNGNSDMACAPMSSEKGA